MNFKPGPLQGLILVEPHVFEDPRGFFLESYRKDLFAANGIDCDFVQDNHSRSKRGTVRGLHFQSAPGQAKLIRCTHGAIWDIAVDIRPKSPTFGQWTGVELTAANHLMLFIPIGFAHGFAVLSEDAEVQYRCSAYYNGATEAGFRWNDPKVGVDWRVSDPILSARDQNSPAFSEVSPGSSMEGMEGMDEMDRRGQTRTSTDRHLLPHPGNQ